MLGEVKDIWPMKNQRHLPEGSPPQQVANENHGELAKPGSSGKHQKESRYVNTIINCTLSVQLKIISYMALMTTDFPKIYQQQRSIISRMKNEGEGYKR